MRRWFHQVPTTEEKKKEVKEFVKERGMSVAGMIRFAVKKVFNINL